MGRRRTMYGRRRHPSWGVSQSSCKCKEICKECKYAGKKLKLAIYKGK